MTVTIRKDIMTPRYEPGAGHPRLIFAAQGEIATREPQREFALDHEITTIGSADNALLRLDGIDAQHSEVRHDANDEYVWVRVGDITTATVHGRPAAHAVLRTGARIELGPWTVSFFREEFADKGSGRSAEFDDDATRR